MSSYKRLNPPTLNNSNISTKKQAIYKDLQFKEFSSLIIAQAGSDLIFKKTEDIIYEKYIQRRTPGYGIKKQILDIGLIINAANIQRDDFDFEFETAIEPPNCPIDTSFQDCKKVAKVQPIPQPSENMEDQIQEIQLPLTFGRGHRSISKQYSIKYDQLSLISGQNPGSPIKRQSSIVKQKSTTSLASFVSGKPSFVRSPNKKKEPQFVPQELNRVNTDPQMRIEQQVFQKEGAENYSHINSIVKNLRKVKAIEDKRKQNLQKLEQDKQENEEKQRKARILNKLSINDPRKLVTTDHMGKPLEVRRQHGDLLPALSQSVLDVYTVGMDNADRKNSKNRSLLKPSQSQQQILSQKSLTQKNDPYPQRLGLVTQMDTQNLVKEIKQTPHFLKNSMLEEANLSVHIQQQQINSINVTHGVKLSLIEKSNIQRNNTFADLIHGQTSDRNNTKTAPLNSARELQKKDYPRSQNQMAKEEYQRNQQKFIIDLTKMPGTQLNNERLNQEVKELDQQQTNNQDTLHFTQIEEDKQIKEKLKDLFKNGSQGQTISTVTRVQTASAVLNHKNDAISRFKSKYLKQLTQRDAITIQSARSLHQSELFNDQSSIKQNVTKIFEKPRESIQNQANKTQMEDKEKPQAKIETSILPQINSSRNINKPQSITKKVNSLNNRMDVVTTGNNSINQIGNQMQQPQNRINSDVSQIISQNQKRDSSQNIGARQIQDKANLTFGNSGCFPASFVANTKLAEFLDQNKKSSQVMRYRNLKNSKSQVMGNRSAR
eukprot:403333680